MAAKMAQWYYGTNGQQMGPLDESEIRSAIAGGLVTPDTLVWRDGMANWQPFQQVPELAAAYAVPAYYDPNAANAGRTSGLAISSMVCGIVGVVTCPVIAAIPAIICGHLAMGQINNAPFPMAGRGMAIAGLALGYLQIIGILGFILFVIIAGHY